MKPIFRSGERKNAFHCKVQSGIGRDFDTLLRSVNLKGFDLDIYTE